ncbi:hypothetical protein SAMN05443428_13810 [Caloramator quimbayensis]|uniref:Uncharacterized protein n=1 Tax=Caloramator quimbayensis TaxID=1147123 RepID=A0A1T4YEP5_9CLOT|nr:hypothetical protein [Caloramator quimbayensis]SKA99781.1 hypothetical protein SAMN05443428_13810 [Caloramator quimbayensis]
MLTDIKAWLETTGFKVAEERFLKPPQLPYLIYIENKEIDGADDKNFIANRNITVELYTDKIDHAAEEKIETLLNEKAIKYRVNRTWIDSEKFYETIYEFNLIEKV